MKVKLAQARAKTHTLTTLQVPLQCSNKQGKSQHCIQQMSAYSHSHDDPQTGCHLHFTYFTTRCFSYFSVTYKCTLEIWDRATKFLIYSHVCKQQICWLKKKSVVVVVVADKLLLHTLASKQWDVLPPTINSKRRREERKSFFGATVPINYAYNLMSNMTATVDWRSLNFPLRLFFYDFCSNPEGIKWSQLWISRIFLQN